jgi:hypothetical protein
MIVFEPENGVARRGIKYCSHLALQARHNRFSSERFHTPKRRGWPRPLRRLRKAVIELAKSCPCDMRQQAVIDAPSPILGDVEAARKRSVLSATLCLSRACLGKLIIFIYTLQKRDRFHTSGAGSVAACDPSASCRSRTRKTMCKQTTVFWMMTPYLPFIPSLSWQIIVFHRGKKWQIGK